MIRKAVPAGVVLVLFLAAPAQALTILNLEGTGNICFYASNGSCASSFSGDFQGVVTRELIGAPGGPDSDSDGTFIQDYNGWVHSTYQFSWASGSYTYEDLASAAQTSDYAYVRDDLDDILYTFRSSYRYETTSGGNVTHTAFASLLSMGLPDWLSGLDLPEGAGLGAIDNISSFAAYSLAAGSTFEGFQGTIRWARAEVTTSVSEPGTLALLGLGLAGLHAARRRRLH